MGFKSWVMEGGQEQEWQGLINNVCVCVCVCVCVFVCVCLEREDSKGGAPCGESVLCHAMGASWQGPKLAWQNVTEDPESRDSGNPGTIMRMAETKAQI